VPAHGGESIDAFAEIHRLGGQTDAALRAELKHERTSRKARTNAASGSVDSGGWMRRRVPSARDSSICVAGGVWGHADAVGTSTKLRGMGGTAGVDA